LAQDPDIAAEDREKWNLDREAYLDSLLDYMKVERVIGARDGETETEYYVKWKGLYYDSCTWELASLVAQEAQHEIDRYLNRTAKLPVSDKNETNINTRSPYKPFRVQPSYIKGGDLREFQIHGINFLAHHWCRGNNVILADEMGLGKTVQTVSFMNWLRNDRRQNGPFIVVVPLSTMPAWADTFDHWTPDINYVVYNGNEAARKIIREYELLVDGNPKKVKFNVLLTTYEYILVDSGFLSSLKWQFMAVDEAHRLKNRESQLYAKLMDFGAPSRLLITGTPMQNTLSELSALMDFLMPGKVVVDEEIDLMSEHASRKLAELTDAISPYMIRRTKQKVENDLPPKTEKIIRVELSDVQLEYYKNILTRNYAALNAGNKAGKTSLLNIMMELKKASNHPFMFPNAEDRILAGSDAREDQLKALITSSGKMMLLDQLLTKMKRDGHRVLIFSQMVKMLDILGDYLQLRGHQFQRLDGTIAAGPRRMAIDHFNAKDSNDFCFLLSTRAGGLGINLMTADTVIIFDSDWNPQADLQAMARAHRIGQKKPVTIYRLVSKDTVEEEVLERARNKLMLEFITIQRGVTDKDARELGDRMAKVGASTAEPTSSDDISRILKRRGQKMFEQTGNQRKLEELDIDAVLENAEEHQTEQPQGMTTDGGEEFLRSFEYTDVKIDLEWDEIIPKHELDKIKEAERKKQEEAYLASVIEDSQPRKRKAPGDDGRDQRAAKKRARDLNAAAEMEDGSGDDDSDHGSDPKRALGEKECRHLIRAYERYGSIDEKQDEIIREARLIGRDVDVVRDTLKEIIDTAVRLQKEQADQLAELERTTNKPITKKERKAVLFDFRGVKRLNAQTLTERPEEMKMVRDCVDQTPDWRTFRVPEAQKPASYTAEWGAKEDGMLCVGIARHGYGAWIPIRDDPELGLTEKFYLEEHRVGAKEARNTGENESKQAKSPGAVHLVRRANYLISVLKDKISNGTNQAAKKALENHHRNNRKHMGQHGRVSTPGHAGSPGPSSNRKSHSGSMHQSDIRNSLKHGSPNGHVRRDDRGKPRHSEDRKLSNHRNNGSAANGGPRPSMSEADQRVRKIMDPIHSTLVKVSGATKKKMPEDDARLKMIKMGLVAIGNHITTQVQNNGQASFEDKLWDYVSEHHWPQSKSNDKRVSGHKLKDMYKKISGKDNAAAANKSSPTKPRPVPTEAGASKPATNGSATPAVKAEAVKVEVPKVEAPKTEPVKKKETPVKNIEERKVTEGTASDEKTENANSKAEVKCEGGVETAGGH
jgi:chromodomain-helicase-DNA-binding protein 1